MQSVCALRILHFVCTLHRESHTDGLKNGNFDLRLVLQLERTRKQAAKEMRKSNQALHCTYFTIENGDLMVK